MCRRPMYLGTAAAARAAATRGRHAAGHRVGGAMVGVRSQPRRQRRRGRLGNR